MQVRMIFWGRIEDWIRSRAQRSARQNDLILWRNSIVSFICHLIGRHEKKSLEKDGGGDVFDNFNVSRRILKNPSKSQQMVSSFKNTFSFYTDR